MNTTRYANHNAAGMALGLQSGELYEQEEDCHTCITQHTHNGRKFEVYYDELAGPFSQWKAFCAGIGTKSGLDRENVIKAMRQAISKMGHEREANARLIDAAPNMLEALEGVIALAQDPAGRSFTMSEFLHEYEGKAVLAAITKATQG